MWLAGKMKVLVLSRFRKWEVKAAFYFIKGRGLGMLLSRISVFQQHLTVLLMDVLAGAVWDLAVLSVTY